MFCFDSFEDRRGIYQNNGEIILADGCDDDFWFVFHPIESSSDLKTNCLFEIINI